LLYFGNRVSLFSEGTLCLLFYTSHHSWDDRRAAPRPAFLPIKMGSREPFAQAGWKRSPPISASLVVKDGSVSPAQLLSVSSFVWLHNPRLVLQWCLRQPLGRLDKSYNVF
jgi:hypothetical protein